MRNIIGYIVFLCVFFYGAYLVVITSPELAGGLALMILGYSIATAFIKEYLK